ncbi:MAG: DUF1177 domain-containing protein [Ignisphaera sp.]|nr:DUF1177 domain-containing protein [Ignisphaera sp.]
MSALKYVMEIADLLEDPKVSGKVVKRFFEDKGLLGYMEVSVETVQGEKGSTDFITIRIPGREGKSSGGKAPTLGVVGRLGGVGARPAQIGMVSDADGAIVALAVAYKVAEMKRRGDVLPGDVIITTHVCPNAPTRPHHPVPMMDSPVDIFTLLKKEVTPEMDAILSVDATKANWVIKHTGFAITPTVKEGWILKVSPDLIDIYIRVTGEPPVIVPITMQDLIPYSTPVYHLNSMMQPWLYTKAPVVGVAITTRMAVPGSATGATNIVALEQATRFVIEVAKEFTAGRAKFYDEKEWETLMRIHGPVDRILRAGAPP